MSLENHHKQNGYSASKKDVIGWNYDDADEKIGPRNWLSNTGTPKCGNEQSPIDIKLDELPRVPLNDNPFRFVNYRKNMVCSYICVKPAGST